MDEAAQSQQEHAESPQSGELSREKLIQKCKTLLTIAQKAKTARDEALEERAKLLKEVEDARNIIKKKDEQYKNVEEIMGALTDQKLKLAMDMDTLKKEKASFLEQFKVLASEKENYESEAESLRRRYDRLLSENEDLIGELQIRERSESQLLNDIKKLHENNESVKVLCTNVTQEKIHLEEELGSLRTQVEELTAERNLWTQTLCSKLGTDRLELKDLVLLADGMPPTKSPVTEASGNDRIEELSRMLTASQKDNEAFQEEIASLKDKTQRLMSELETANVDRDQMMTNLEGVRVETKTLIENVEKLSEEIDAIKIEKQKSEGALNRVIESKNEEIDSLLTELSKSKDYVSELLASLESHMGGKNEGTVHSEESAKLVAENEQLRRALDDLQHSGQSKALKPQERNILVILKEGIVSNLKDLADTMPEYSREFLNKLDAILEGADCQGEVGADVFVHYFNECLSQLKISLKENEILSKEVDHLKNSIKELENSVSNHNNDCEMLRGELEELSSDSNRLLVDLSNLRHENSIRVTEIGELMVRLKQRDEQVDQLKEANYQLEMKYASSMNEITTQLAEANNNFVQLQEKNSQLESQVVEYQTLLADVRSGASQETLAVQEELASAKQSMAALQQDLNKSHICLQEALQEIEELQTVLKQSEASKEDCQSLSAKYDLLRIQLEDRQNTLNQRTAELEDTKQLLAQSVKEKEQALNSHEKINEEMKVLRKKLEELQGTFNVQSLELLSAREGLSQNESLMKELENVKHALNAKSSALEDAERHLQDSAEISSQLELTKKKLEEKSLELEKSRKQIEELAVVSAELENMKALNQKVVVELQGAFDLAREKELKHHEEVNKLKESLQKNVEELQSTKTLLNESQAVKKEVHDLGKALKQQSSELEKAQRILQEKASVEEELSQLKVIQQKTMEELENTKKRLNESQSARKNVQEMEKALKAKTAELEKALFILDEHKAAEMTVSEELEKVKETLKAKSEDLERFKKLSNDTNKVLEEKSKLADECVRLRETLDAALRDSEGSKNTSRELEITLNGKIKELVSTLGDRDNALVASNKKLEESEASKSKALTEKDAVINSKVEELSRVGEECCRLKESLEGALRDSEGAKNMAREIETTLTGRIRELETMLGEKDGIIAAVNNKMKQNEESKAHILKERDDLIVKVEEFETGRSLLMESEGIASELKEQLEKLQKELSNSEKLTEVESNEKQKALQDLQRLSEEVQCLRCENQVLTDKLAEQGRLAVGEMKKKNDEIQKLSKELEESKEMVNFKKMELEDINCIWAGRLNSLKVNMSSLGRSLHDLGRQTRELQHMFVERVRMLLNVITASAENVVELSVAEAKKELLDEMHRMNEVLKDRGEAISKLQDTLADTEGKLDALKIQNAELSSEQGKMQSALKTKEEKLASSESQMKELESEISRLKELKETAPESDVLSTSTISRSEDHMRLKEVDDSIEEKYLKLRQVAVKLKKRVSELTAALEQEKSKHGDKSELLEKIQHLSSAAKNAQKVQESYDRTLDELDEAKKQIAAMSATIKESNGILESLKKQVSSLESQNANIPLMQKQMEGLNITIKELKGEVNRLEMEKKVEVMKYEESKKQCTALEAKVENLTHSLDQAVQQGRSNNVLELEMKNYEKVVTDLTAQLNSEKQKLANSEKELSAISLVKSGLEEQLALLEKQLKSEESRNASLQDQITTMREKANLSQHQVEEVNAQLSDLKRELHHSKNQSEQLALEMSNLTSEFSRKEIDLQGKIESFTSHIQSLETNLATAKQELSTSNSEKEHLREEFDSYRLRAQSMLARQKGDTISQGEKEAREQFDKLKKELDVAREKMENNQTEIETLNNKLSSLQLEKSRSDKRYEDITKALHQKITDYDTLNTEYRAFKFSAETLLQNTKIEFEEKERELKEQVSSLNELIVSLNEKVLEMQGLQGAELKFSETPPTPYSDFQHPHENLPSLQEREDGEGSESVPPPMSNYRRLSNLVPLDILLNNPIADENRIPVLQEQIEKLHSELNSYEVRVKHLASLLSEAEKDAARSSQQNAVLKEELRRLERSLQREPHIANSEYLKNVIFKFLVLQSGDERQRLVPVLDTILKLSPEETSRLTAVAKGETASWGSYLHSWTGL